MSSLAVPIILSAIALFFASFLSWMVLQLHKPDWKRLDRQDDLMAALRPFNLAVGSYMFPCPKDHKEMQLEEFKAKYTAGPRGLMTILAPTNMGVNLGLTLGYFLIVSFVIGYLASMGLPKGTDFLAVFRFIFAAGMLAFLAGIVQHSIWFRNRVFGHLIESIFYSAIIGTIFAAMWPA